MRSGLNPPKPLHRSLARQHFAWVKCQSPWHPPQGTSHGRPGTHLWHLERLGEVQTHRVTARRCWHRNSPDAKKLAQVQGRNDSREVGTHCKQKLSAQNRSSQRSDREQLRRWRDLRVPTSLEIAAPCNKHQDQGRAIGNARLVTVPSSIMNGSREYSEEVKDGAPYVLASWSAFRGAEWLYLSQPLCGKCLLFLHFLSLTALLVTLTRCKGKSV